MKVGAKLGFFVGFWCFEKRGVAFFAQLFFAENEHNSFCSRSLSQISQFF